MCLSHSPPSNFEQPSVGDYYSLRPKLPHRGCLHTLLLIIKLLHLKYGFTCPSRMLRFVKDIKKAPRAYCLGSYIYFVFVYINDYIKRLCRLSIASQIKRPRSVNTLLGSSNLFLDYLRLFIITSTTYILSVYLCPNQLYNHTCVR